MPLYMAQKEKIEKGVLKMTDGIGRIFGGNSYGVGGYVPQRKGEVPEEPQAPVVQPETKNVNPDDVMKLLSANNPLPVKSEFKMVELDAATKDRIADEMAKFVSFVETAKAELGSEKLALDLADMKSLM